MQFILLFYLCIFSLIRGLLWLQICMCPTSEMQIEIHVVCIICLVASLSSWAVTQQSSITSHAFIIIRPTICPWATLDKREGKNKREINVTRPKSISLESPYSSLIMLCIRYKIKLNSDELQYGGHGRLVQDTEFFTEPMPFNGRAQSFLVSFISTTPFHS